MAEEKRGGRVRLRNCDYALTGSINMEGKKPISYRLEPNRWTEVPAEVYASLKSKFGEPKFEEVPNALPEADGTYKVAQGAVRYEPAIQYVIEFA